MPYRDRVSSPGPKKLLAKDGGGIRGVITLEVQGRMESIPTEQLCEGDDVGQAAAGEVAVEHFAGFREGRP